MWNCIRALDYLETLDFVDQNRFGVTGRSGGGAYSWWISALDERIKVAASVAGITDLTNHVVSGGTNGRYKHGTVEGHCDCMFQVNTYRWDYAQVAALVAPRPLLILNTDDDSIFPLDGVVRVYNQVRRIYELHDAKSKLGLVITPGGHQDTREIRLPAFNWFNQYLKDEKKPIKMFAHTFFEPEQLKVFSEIPSNQRNAQIQDSFTRLANDTNPVDAERILTDLKEKTFGGWPETLGDLDLEEVFDVGHNGVRFAGYDFNSQIGIRLRMYITHQMNLAQPKKLHLEIINNRDWIEYLKLGRTTWGRVWKEEMKLAGIDNNMPVTEEIQTALGWMHRSGRNSANQRIPDAQMLAGRIRSSNRLSASDCRPQVHRGTAYCR